MKNNYRQTFVAVRLMTYIHIKRKLLIFYLKKLYENMSKKSNKENNDF